MIDPMQINDSDESDNFLPPVLPTELNSVASNNLIPMSDDIGEPFLYKLSEKLNIAEDLDEDKLTEIAHLVLSGYEEDLKTNQEWLESVNDAQKLSKLTKEPKNYPLPNSANIKYPLITNACSQFAARTYPEIVKNGRVVKCAVIGKPTTEKEALAERVSKHMSYQLLQQSPEWEKSLDTLLIMLANVGVVFKKTFYDPLKNRIRSILCDYKDIVVNSGIQELTDARRITHKIPVYMNDLFEGMKAKVYLPNVVEDLAVSMSSDELDNSFDILEQHRYLDLDEDGYEEPYIVTVCTKNNKVLRIAARYTSMDIGFDQNDQVMRITPIHYFTDFHFLPSPDGKFHSFGFGTLMLHLNETINTILNQLIDAGRLTNLRGGYIDARLKLPSGQTLHDPGEWKRVKATGLVSLRDGMYPIEYKEPSSVLYQLLALLIQTGKELSSSTEALKGTESGQRTPVGTMQQLIDQGLKEFLAIQRRIFRSLKEEFQKIYKLNKIYLDPIEYITVLDDELAIAQKDYDNSSIDILPVADPNLSSDTQRLIQDQALLMIMNEPQVDKREILSRHLEVLQVSNKDKILPPPKPEAPNLEAIQVQADIENQAQQLNLKARELTLKEQQFAADAMKTQMEILKLYNESLKIAAEAEAIEPGQQLEMYKAHLEGLRTKFDAILKDQGLNHQIMTSLMDKKNIENQNAQTPPSAGMV